LLLGTNIVEALIALRKKYMSKVEADPDAGIKLLALLVQKYKY
jgi:hypothetical protein